MFDVYNSLFRVLFNFGCNYPWILLIMRISIISEEKQI